MALFGSARDASLVRSINRELINDFIDMEVAFYKLSLEDTRSNMYDESDSKVYYQPMRINCLIEKGEKNYVGEDAGYDSTREGFFNFLRDDLKDKNIIIEEGDIIEYDNEFYEIDGVGASQYFAGRNPNHDIGFVEGDREEFGLSIAVRVTAHVTRRNRLNIQEVRSGINKPSIIPRNL
jgi:hypothetical protein|tara:strand:+ start:61 stop:597 length:537 start_codon:yes stop_codon:yes gene_type:complete